jgi:WD40 repeat protein
VEDIDDTMFDDVKIRYLGNSSPIEKLSIDHRINCVRAFVLKTDEDLDESEGGDSYQPIIVVVTGDSNGSCYEYQFIKSFTTSGKLVYKDERPILCLDIVPSASDYLLFVGGTAGDVAMIYLTLPVEPYDDSDPTLRLLIHAHSMGTNSISVRTLSSNYNNRVLRILSCGDDQSISCRDVTISSYGRVDARNAKCKVKNAALSALKGIHFIANNLVVVTGYDQKISLWRYISNKSLVKVHECATDIGDVNCFSICSIGGTHRCSQLLVVGGAGLEVLQLRIKQPKY